MRPSPRFVPRRRSILALAVAAACLPRAGHAADAPANAAAVTPQMMSLAADLFFSREQERARAKRTLDMDRSKLAMARRSSLLLIDGAPQILPASAGWSWSVDVETREEPLAYCLPNGRIMLSTGL